MRAWVAVALVWGAVSSLAAGEVGESANAPDRRPVAAVLSPEALAAVASVHAMRADIVRQAPDAAALASAIERTRRVLRSALAGAEVNGSTVDVGALAAERDQILAARQALLGRPAPEIDSQALRARSDELIARIDELVAAPDEAARRTLARALLEDIDPARRARPAATGPTFRFAYPVGSDE